MNDQESSEALIVFAPMQDLLVCVRCETKIEVLRMLSQMPCTVKALCDKLALSQSLVSHHLADLRVVGLVVPTRSGQSKTYNLTNLVTIEEEWHQITITIASVRGSERLMLTLPLRRPVPIVHAMPGREVQRPSNGAVLIAPAHVHSSTALRNDADTTSK